MDNSLTLQYLHSILIYNKNTGLFLWKYRDDVGKKWNNRNAGKVAGTKNKNRHVTILINRIKYKAHRLAWFYVTGFWPKENIDHRDLNKSNNIWKNLREATHAQNSMNRKLQPNNLIGFKGVSWKADRDKWMSRIKKDRRQIFLGYFQTPEEAHNAYVVASKKYHGEFARAS